MMTKKEIKEGFHWFWGHLKVNKLWKLIFFSFWGVLFLGIGQGYYDSVFTWLGIISFIYPAILFVVLFFYAWLINPIREWWPNSWVTKNIIVKHIDKLRTWL